MCNEATKCSNLVEYPTDVWSCLSLSDDQVL